MSQPKLPSEIKRAITLRLAGYTISSIVAKTGVSASTLYRYFKQLDVMRGQVTVESIDEARENLINDASFVDQLKLTIASSIADDLALSRQIREAISISLDSLLRDARIPTTTKTRSLVALATALKLTQDVQRKALNIDRNDQSNQLDDLPELTITKMTDVEIQAAQDRFKNEEEYEEDEIA